MHEGIHQLVNQESREWAAARMRTRAPGGVWIVIVLALAAGLSLAQAPIGPPTLPKPRTSGGKPLLTALQERKTWREIGSDKLPLQMLSDLLWAGFGQNRAETGGRTAPSAMNAQEIDIYVATGDGLFLFDAKQHQLKPLLTEDLRPKSGGQPFVKEAPVSLFFVADLARMVKAKPSDKEFYAAIDTGYISQNIYLFCASEGLASVAHDLDRAPLAKAMNLRPDQKIILAQVVGYPKKPAAAPGAGS